MILRGLYGNEGDCPCTVFTTAGWYCIQGSININRAYAMWAPEDLPQPIHVERLDDYDGFTVQSPVESLDELVAHVEDRCG